ncbi:hypothetical protein [Chitinimonas lacunae]|uniref:Uncharacterized protein n=1 Tax=Chitinimonas lacunae TaxID=1963018 RepID=A0ABV8MVN5_9NEIS
MDRKILLKKKKFLFHFLLIAPVSFFSYSIGVGSKQASLLIGLLIALFFLLLLSCFGKKKKILAGSVAALLFHLTIAVIGFNIGNNVYEARSIKSLKKNLPDLLKQKNIETNTENIIYKNINCIPLHGICTTTVIIGPRQYRFVIRDSGKLEMLSQK